MGEALTQDEFFSEQWPSIARRLASVLTKNGAPRSEVEDLVQETAARLVKAWHTVDQSRSVEAFARTVALNAWRDQWRRRGNHEVLKEEFELASRESHVEDVTIARMEIQRVGRALRSLPAQNADVIRGLVADSAGGGAGPVSAATRMARSRARFALTRVLETAVGALLLLGGALRRGRRVAGAVAAMGAGAAVAFSVLGIAGATAGRDGADSAATTNHVFRASSGTEQPDATSNYRYTYSIRAWSRVEHGRTTRTRAAEPNYYFVGVGPTKVGAYLDLHKFGYGIKVQRTKSGVPVCTYGRAPKSGATCSADSAGPSRRR